MGARLSTGVQELDRALRGGLAPATLVVLQTPPGSQGELLLKEFVLAQATLYLTTTRTVESVRDWLTGASAPDGVDIQHVGYRHDGNGSVAADTDNPSSLGSEQPANSPSPEPLSLAPVMDAISGFQDRGYILIDPVNPVEQFDEGTYMQFLHAVRDRLVETESVGVLHAVTSEAVPPCRWLSLQFADSVWDVRVERDGIDIDFTLGVTKSRAGHLPEEEIKLVLSDRVGIDVSRDIA